MSNFMEEQGMSCLAKMTEDDKFVFVKTLTSLAKTDGEYDHGEQKFVEDLFNVFGLPAKMKENFKVSSDEDVIADAAKIKDRHVAMELIKEMCMLANSDGDLTDREAMLIGQVGLAMNIELEKIEQISRWVIDRIVWIEEGKIIFEQV